MLLSVFIHKNLSFLIGISFSGMSFSYSVNVLSFLKTSDIINLHYKQIFSNSPLVMKLKCETALPLKLEWKCITLMVTKLNFCTIINSLRFLLSIAMTVKINIIWLHIKIQSKRSLDFFLIAVVRPNLAIHSSLRFLYNYLG